MSFPTYPDYKDSGVEWLGKVPSHWNIARFKHIFEERNERSQYGDETLLSVSAYTGVRPRSEIRDDDEYLSRAESLEGYKICYREDLVMNIMLAWNRGLGVTNFDGIVSPAYCVFRHVGDCSVRFLDYLVRSDDYIGYFKCFSRGVIDSRLRLYPEDFGGLFAALPDREEQSLIAAFLDHETAKIDALIAEQETLIELLKEKRQAVISHAVTKGLDPNAPMKDSGVEWLGEIPAHWSITRLKFVAHVQGGVAKGRELNGMDTIEVPFLRVANVQDGYLDLNDVANIEIPPSELPRYSLQYGDVLMNEGGDFDKLGRGHIWRSEIEPCIHQNHVFAVRPAHIDSEWLNLLTSAAYGRFYFMSRSKQSTNLASISSTNIHEFPLLMPPASERKTIVAHVEKECAATDSLLHEAQHAISLLKERRSALISAAVTGKIDVRGYAPQPEAA